MKESPSPIIVQLMEAAYNARKSAYCPYSNFHVGAAVLAEDDTIVTGNTMVLI